LIYSTLNLNNLVKASIHSLFLRYFLIAGWCTVFATPVTAANSFGSSGLFAQNRSSDGTSVEEMEKRVENLENRLNQIMQILIPDVENALQSVLQSKVQSDSATIMIINRINTIQNKIKILEDKASYSDSTNFEILAQLIMIENKIVTLTRSFNEQYDLRTDKTIIEQAHLSSEEFKRRYIRSLGLYQDGKYQDAIENFSDLVINSPDYPLADNCQYWLGESYYSLKNYKRALLEFQKVFEFTDSDKWDDAQLKMGICYKNMGDARRAKEEFKKLLDYYPGSEYYRKANQYLNQL